MTHGSEGKETIWNVKVGVFRGEQPKWAGHRNVAVVRRTADDALVLNTGFDLSGIVWLGLVVAAGVVDTISVFGKTHSLIDISGIAVGTAGFFAVSALVVWSRPRIAGLDLGNTVSEVIVDEQRGRIALLAKLGTNARWIVLSEFRGRFSEVSAAMRDAFSERCRRGQITEGSLYLLIIVLAVVVACLVVYGFVAIQPT